MNPADVVLTDHAIARYRERVKPALAREDARLDLVRILHLVPELELLECPPWPTVAPHGTYAELVDGICLAGHLTDGKLIVTTVLVNASLSEQSRARRRRRKNKRRVERAFREQRAKRLADLGLTA